MDEEPTRDGNFTQMLQVKVKAPEDTSHGVVLDVPESSYIKEEVEEVLIDQEENRLCVKEESSADGFHVSTTSIKSEDDAETPLFSQLHKPIKEEDDCPTTTSETVSSEMEVYKDSEMYGNVNHLKFQLKRWPECDINDNEQESRASVTKANDLSKSLICSHCGEQFDKDSLKRHKTRGCSSVLQQHATSGPYQPQFKSEPAEQGGSSGPPESAEPSTSSSASRDASPQRATTTADPTATLEACTLSQAIPSITPQTSAPRPATKKKRRRQLELDDSLLQQMLLIDQRRAELFEKLDKHEPDEYTRFGQTVADLVRRVPEHLRVEAMRKIMSCIFDLLQ